MGPRRAGFAPVLRLFCGRAAPAGRAPTGSHTPKNTKIPFASSRPPVGRALADSTHLHLRPCFILLDEEDNVSLRRECQKTPGSLDATFNYSSPEALDPEMYGPLCTQSDVWSFACCVVEMTSGRPPWHGKEDAFKQFAHCFKSATAPGANARLTNPASPRDGRAARSWRALRAPLHGREAARAPPCKHT